VRCSLATCLVLLTLAAAGWVTGLGSSSLVTAGDSAHVRSQGRSVNANACIDIISTG